MLQASSCNTGTTQNQPHRISNTQRTENKTTDVVIQQHSRKFLMVDTLMSETCWAHKKWNKIASDMKLVFHSSTISSVVVFLPSCNSLSFMCRHVWKLCLFHFIDLVHMIYGDGKECSETSAYKIQTPGDHLKELIHSQHCESFKSRISSIS